MLFRSPRVDPVTVTITDDNGGVATFGFYVVFYDPSFGFVTGGGWIDSPAGSYTPNLSLFGKATFGFVSKYKKGATIPDGNTEFQFHAGNLNFKSTVYQWLVVQGSTRASFKGNGTINGAGNYIFLVSVVDGSPDKLRMKITDTATNTVVYDNNIGASEDAVPTTALGGGSIVIHTN